MGSSRMRLKRHAGVASPFTYSPVSRNGVFPRCIRGTRLSRAFGCAGGLRWIEAEALSVSRISADSPFHHAPRRMNRAVDDRQIELAGLSLAELSSEILVGFGILRYNDHTGGVFVQTMNDAGTNDLSPEALTHGFHVMDDAVNQGVGRVAVPGMHHESGGLVHRNHPGIFVEYLQIHGLGLERRRLGSREPQGNDVFELHGLCKLRRHTVHPDLRAARFELTPSHRAEHLRNVAVDPHTRVTGVVHGHLKLGDPPLFVSHGAPHGARRSSSRPRIQSSTATLADKLTATVITRRRSSSSSVCPAPKPRTPGTLSPVTLPASMLAETKR